MSNSAAQKRGGNILCAKRSHDHCLLFVESDGLIFVERRVTPGWTRERQNTEIPQEETQVIPN